MATLRQYRLERKIRAGRRRTFKKALAKHGGRYQRIPFRLRQRLEREPVIFDRGPLPQSYTDRELSYIALSRKPQKREDHIYSRIRDIGPILLRKVMDGMKLSESERKAINKRFKKDEYFTGKFWNLMLKPNDPRNADIYYGIVRQDICTAFQQTGLLTGVADRKAARFIDTSIRTISDLQKAPRFYFNEVERRWGRRIQAEPGFERFLASFPRQDLTAFIESRPNVRRAERYSMSEARKILHIAEVPYDVSRVKEFTLTTPQGEKLSVVSKRLSPIKSITAEKEFENSKTLYRLGIPTPAPIGVIKATGNTYFLWQRLEAADPVPEQFEKEAEKQKRSIKARLVRLGVKQRDIHDRNFIVTNEQGKPKVWLVDLERMEIPKAVRQRAKTA